MSICSVPFCQKVKKPRHCLCYAHLWETQKYHVKRFRQILLFNPKKPNKKVSSEKQKIYNQRSKIKRDNWRLQKRYQISLDEYNNLLQKQNSKCAICHASSNQESRPNDRAQRFDIDHCHITKKIRGLLCRRCNIFIGYIDKDLHLLDKIKAYLTL
jgi:hypothetical protein